MTWIMLTLSRASGDFIHRLATNVPSIACVINSLSTFTYYLDLLNFILESGLSYFRVLTNCLLFFYFVSFAGCYCFDFIQSLKNS